MSSTPVPETPVPETAAASQPEQSWLPYYLRKAGRHIHWARTEGLGRLVEEDRLDPRERIATGWRKAQWRRGHGVPPGSARAVYVVGLQRSGTNMLMRGVDQAPEVEVRNENDRTVFHRFRLRSDAVLAATVRASRHSVVLVKPLCESHRVDQFLDLPGMAGGRALWVYRDAEGRARSEVSKFGDSNLQALRVIAAGNGETIWQGQRLPASTVATVRSFDYTSMTPETAAVLFWVVRNELYFDLRLDTRADVLLVSYDAFVRDPGPQMRRLCDFIGLAYRPELCAHVEPRASHGEAPLEIDPDVRALAEGLAARLDAGSRATAGGIGAPEGAAPEL
jgi:hypothetical protein